MSGPEPRIALVGPRGLDSSYSRVNRAWWRELATRGERWRCADTLAEAGRPDAVVLQDYALEVAELEPPPSPRSALARTWDFGPYPPAWVRKIERDWAQLWVPSEWLRELALRGGVGAEKIRVVPHGCDVDVFRPEGPKLELPTRKRVVFLFVGAPVRRKGLDVLLEAWVRAFRSEDDVCLVLKTSAEEVFYEGQSLVGRVEELRRNGGPEILLIDRRLSVAEMAALARSASAGVFPYRAEGFALPILEALACGLPCIVPDFGPALEYTDAASSFRLPVRRMALPVVGDFVFNSLGFSTEVEEVDFCEPRVEALSRLLREVASLPADALRERGRRGATRARRDFAWTRSVAAVERCADELLRGTGP